MLTVAAIEYVCDQRAPSRPYLLKLDIPETPTKEQLDLALREHFADVARDEGEDAEEITADTFAVTKEEYYGDLRVSFKDDQDHYVFVSLPGDLRALADEFKRG